MSRATSLPTIRFGTLLLLWLCATTAQVQANSRPNVLFILADDHTTQAISCYGGPLAQYAQTQHIDRLASEGVRLSHCFCTNAICTPSRATILTGQYSHQNGVYLLNQSLPVDSDTFPQAFQRAGYQTGLFGKWHLGSRPQGFDDYRVLEKQGRYRDPEFLKPGSPDPVTYPGWSTDVITDLTLEFLRRRDPQRPFLALCHYKATHDPWDARPPYQSLWKSEQLPEPSNLLDDYANRSAAALRTTLKLEQINQSTFPHQRLPTADSLTQRQYIYQQYIKSFLRCGRVLDENVGRLLRYLDESGLRENTLVVYTADQGHFLGEHGFFSKRFMYDESMRMPWVARLPRTLPSGTVNADMISNVDIAPTLLEAAGISIPPSMQGRSFWSNLQGETPRNWPNAIYYHYWQHLLHRNVTAHYGIRTRTHKLIFYYGLPLGMTEFPAVPPEWELFDLTVDPQEMRNVVSDPAQAALLRKLQTQLNNMKRDCGDLDARYPELAARRQTSAPGGSGARP